jgi:acyl carrier protein
MKDDFIERVQDVFREVFENDAITIFNEMQAKDVKGWDSLAHVNLIMALEDTFQVRFTTREVMGFQNVGEMLACLRGKLAK